LRKESLKKIKNRKLQASTGLEPIFTPNPNTNHPPKIFCLITLEAFFFFVLGTPGLKFHPHLLKAFSQFDKTMPTVLEFGRKFALLVFQTSND